MARYTDTTKLSPKWVKDYADNLRRIAALLDGNHDQMASHKIGELEATHFQTSQEALVKLQKFCGALTEALVKHRQEEQPQKTLSKKSLATPKDPKKH